MTPRCRECKATATEYPLMAKQRVKIVCQDTNDRVLCSGYHSREANEKLPKTSPRWCPRRTKKEDAK